MSAIHFCRIVFIYSFFPVDLYASTPDRFSLNTLKLKPYNFYIWDNK